MIDVLDPFREQIAALCQRYGVRRLEVFGSATTDAFDIERSDFDFLVDFDPHDHQDLFHRYFDLNDALEKLLRRKVDLVMVDAMKNPFFIESVNQTRKQIYAAEVTQTA